MNGNDMTSRSRRRLLDTARLILERAEELIAERGPLLKGAFQLRGTRCGKPGCRCTRGALHPTAVLVVSDEGRRRSYYVRPSERAEVQRRVERYHRFRGLRGELNRLATEVLAAADELLAALLEPHRPERTASAEARRPRHRRR